MGKRAVTFSAAGGVLRVWNPMPVNARVVVGEMQAIVSPGCMKEFAFPEGSLFQIIDMDGAAGAPRQMQDAPIPPPPNPPATPLLDTLAAADEALRRDTSQPDLTMAQPPGLIGSSVQPAVFEDLVVPLAWNPQERSLDTVICQMPTGQGEPTEKLPADYRVVQLGDVVQAAYELSDLSIRQWNALTQDNREQAIAETLELLRAAAVPVGLHHALNLSDGAGTIDRMGAPELPAGQIRGRRVHDTDRFAPGDYGKHPVSGVWMANAPGGGLGNLDQHEVTEHEDGTITVSPSILITSGPPAERERWHGYLEHGIWRTA